MFIRISIYFNSSEAAVALSEIATLINCERTNGDYLVKQGYFISIEENDEFDILRSKDRLEGFLYFPYGLEIDIDDNIDQELIISDMNKILNYLWGNGYPAVTACSFEDKLLHSGGYNSDATPWL